MVRRGWVDAVPLLHLGAAHTCDVRSMDWAYDSGGTLPRARTDTAVCVRSEPQADPGTARHTSLMDSTGRLETNSSNVSSQGNRIPFKETLVFEFILAVVWVITYLKAGESWQGLAALAIKYHWPGAKAFQDLFVPGLTAHSRDLAWSFPVVAIVIGGGYRYNWPIGFYTVFISGIIYSYLTLGILCVIPIALTLLGMWWLQNRSIYPLTNVFFALFLTFWVYGLAATL